MTISSFFAGTFAATFAASGLFFFKFWRASRDPFFLNFGIACWLLVFERFVVVFLDGGLHLITPDSEALAYIYLIRLSAFAVITAGIYKKNQRRI